jgi:hypothetical protein
MSIFGKIRDAIFHRHQATKPDAPGRPAPTTPPPTPQSPRPSPATPEPGAPPTEAVDVEAVLSGMASQKGGGGNWRTSIVDLLKLLDLDSSLEARKALAEELNVHAGPHGSAEQNVALQKAVWKKLAENGGKVPAELKD